MTTVNNALDPISTLDQIRISTLDIARDAGIEIPTPRLLDSIGNRAALTMDTLIRLIAFRCLSDTFHFTSLMTLITSEAPIAFLVGIVCV